MNSYELVTTEASARPRRLSASSHTQHEGEQHAGLTTGDSRRPVSPDRPGTAGDGGGGGGA